MRKLPLLLLASLLVVAVSCSSSKKSATTTSTSTPTTTKAASSDPQVKQLCDAIKRYGAVVASPGSDSAAFHADAAKLQQIATTINTNPPADIATAAKATAASIQAAATKLGTAGSVTEARTQLLTLAFNASNDKNVAAFIAWQKSHC